MLKNPENYSVIPQCSLNNKQPSNKQVATVSGYPTLG